MTRDEYLLQLHQLLEGEPLPPEHEEALFWALATDEELRTAFRQVLVLNRLLPQEQLYAPAVVEESVLQRIGLQKSSFWQRRPWVLATLSAILGSALTALSFLLLPVQRTAAPTPETPALFPTPPDVQMVIPAPPSQHRTPTTVRHQMHHQPAALASIAAEPAPALAPEPTERVEPAQPRAIDLTPTPLRDWALLPRLPGRVFPTPAADHAPIRLSVRSLGAWEINSPDVSLPSRAPLGLHDFAGGLYASISAQHALGVEVGSEAFPQEFSSRTGTLYRQRPTLLWAGLSHHWTLFPERLSPFTRTTLGGTLIGPLGKIWLGAEFPIGSTAYALVGVEGTVLLYRFDQRWFVTRKLGLSYGITLGR